MNNVTNTPQQAREPAALTTSNANRMVTPPRAGVVVAGQGHVNQASAAVLNQAIASRSHMVLPATHPVHSIQSVRRQLFGPAQGVVPVLSPQQMQRLQQIQQQELQVQQQRANVVVAGQGHTVTAPPAATTATVPPTQSTNNQEGV